MLKRQKISGTIFAGGTGKGNLKGRDAAPSHFLLKIGSFSLFPEGQVYESEIFKAGGHKWKFHLYPFGDWKSGGEDHISVYLELADTCSLPLGWKVDVIFNVLVYNQKVDKYFSFEDGTFAIFHALKTECGFTKFIPWHIFKDDSNGFLINDTCVFGAEVFIVHSTCNGKRLSMIPDPMNYSHNWRVNGLSRKEEIEIDSEIFVAGDYKWSFSIYHKGDNQAEDNYVSLFMKLDLSTLPPDTELQVNMCFTLKDEVGRRHFHDSAGSGRLSHSSPKWGLAEYISLTRFYDEKNGFVVDNMCTVEARVAILGIITPI